YIFLFSHHPIFYSTSESISRSNHNLTLTLAIVGLRYEPDDLLHQSKAKVQCYTMKSG
ncbi:hypothetical protein LINPERPRIM_LOCUS6424, partial [Linum perenne]